MPESEINGGRGASFSGDAMNVRGGFAGQEVLQPGNEELEGPTKVLLAHLQRQGLGASHDPHD